MMSRLSHILVVLILLSVFACKDKKETSGKKTTAERPLPQVDGYIVKSESFAETIEVPGSIVANEVTEVHPEVPGRIVQLNVREGQQVARGTLLAKIFDGDLQAQLRKLQTQLEIAKVNEGRASKLLEIQGISRQDYDASLLTVRNIEADIAIIRTEISRTEVRAPFSGKLGLRDISPGAYVTQASVIATINQVSTLKIDFTVPEKYTSRIYNGLVVNFTVDGVDRQYSAKVVATESNVSVENRNLRVRAVVNSATQGLVPGAFAKVHVDFSPNAHAIFVPTNAIVPTARGKQVIVYTDGKALFNEVETGVRDSSRIEITKGLKQGDTVVVTGIMAMKPEGKIKINKIVNQ
ncbi:MAG: efflux RND transporter periplasmic adaptor subunit [Niabella sp.]